MPDRIADGVMRGPRVRLCGRKKVTQIRSDGRGLGILESWNGGMLADEQSPRVRRTCKFVQNCANLCKAKLQAEWRDGILEAWKVGMTATARGGKLRNAITRVYRVYPRLSAITRGGNTRT